MLNILFPTDFSETSRDAMDFVLSFADSLDAEVTILNAYQSTNSPRRPFIGEGSVRRQIIQKLRKFNRTGMYRALKNVRFRAKEGSITHRLLEASKSDFYDLIAMSRSRRYDWLTQILGSKTSFVSVRAHCPVLVIPPKMDFQGIQNLLILEGEDAKTNLLARGILLDHFDPHADLYTHYLSLGSTYLKSLPSERAEPLLEARAKEKVMTYQEKKKRLKAMIHKQKIDLLVMPVKQKGLWERLFGSNHLQRLILELDIPILVINDHVIRRKSISSFRPPVSKKAI